MLLSVVIPSYNHEQHVLSTIQAAANIDIAEKEIIVIDDGSSDSSTRVIGEYIARMGPGVDVKFIARENRGLVKTLNEGLSIATGKYLYGIASDDIPIPEGVSQLVHRLENKSTLQLALGNALFMDSVDQREFRTSYGEGHKHFFALPNDRRHKELFLHYPHPLLLQTAVFRSSLLRKIGGWREDIISDDFAMFLRIFSELRNIGEDFAFHPEIMACFYRRHEANISRNLQRQFMTIDEALTRLCPPEWRDAACLRNSAIHAITAVECKKMSVAAQLLYSGVARIGIVRSIRAATSELMELTRTGPSRRRANKAETIVRHEAASSILKA